MSLAQLPASTKTIPAYATREQQLAQKHNTAAPYLRLEDGLCRAFLQSGASPCEFEGVKLLFPFIREAALLQLPRQQRHLTYWMFYAFIAGHDLGARHPELFSEVLPDYEVREAYRRLGILQKLSESERGTGAALHYAFGRVVQDQWPNTPPEQLDAVHAESALRALRTGFAAATLARQDDFYGEIPANARMQFGRILWRSLMGAPADAVGLTVFQQLEHPAVRVVSQLYPGRPTECATVQGFLREHLAECGGTSENECPASEAELMDWIASGIEYGRRIQRDHPEIVERIFKECSATALRNAILVAQETAAEAGSLQPAALLPAIKRWQNHTYDSEEPYYYGEYVERVALFADFAVWIPWGLSQPIQTAPESPSQGGQISLQA